MIHLFEVTPSSPFSLNRLQDNSINLNLSIDNKEPRKNVEEEATFIRDLLPYANSLAGSDKQCSHQMPEVLPHKSDFIEFSVIKLLQRREN